MISWKSRLQASFEQNGKAVRRNGLFLTKQKRKERKKERKKENPSADIPSGRGLASEKPPTLTEEEASGKKRGIS